MAAISSATTFAPLILSSMDLTKTDQLKSFQNQVSDMINQLVNRINTSSVQTSTIAGWAIYTGSISTTTSLANITNWTSSASGGLSITLASSTTFTVSGISVVQFTGTTASDLSQYNAQITNSSGTAMGAGSVDSRSTAVKVLSFAGLQSSGSFTIQASSVSGSTLTCKLGIYMFNL